MPELDLDAIRARADAASDGPWTTGHGYEPSWLPHELIISATYPIIEFANDEQGCADADFVAHAREDVPKLIAEIERLRGELIRETHGHEPGLCDEYGCSSCRYCGREKPCGCSLGGN